jgi:hypothetical protein
MNRYASMQAAIDSGTSLEEIKAAMPVMEGAK